MFSLVEVVNSLLANSKPLLSISLESETNLSRLSNFSCSCMQAASSSSVAPWTSFNPSFARVISITLETYITRPPAPPIPAPTRETTSPAPKVKCAMIRPAINRIPPMVPAVAPALVDLLKFNLDASSSSFSIVRFLFGLHCLKVSAKSSVNRSNSRTLVFAWTNFCKTNIQWRK